MITEHMQLTTKADAVVWAGQLGLGSSDEEARMAEWIWTNKPFVGCQYDDHPLDNLTVPEFFKIANGE